MLKFIATDLIVSKGYENNDAVKFTDTGNGESVRFRVGKKVYDSRAENNTRWINLSIKGFGPICDRIKKMQIKEGSYIHIVGRYDEESWNDEKTGPKTQPVIILEDIEYASGGGNKTAKDKQDNAAPAAAPATGPENSPNFAGFSAFGGGSFFDS